MDLRGMDNKKKPPKGQGGAIGDEYITCEIERDKAPKLAQWLNEVDAHGYELAMLEGYGGGGSVYLLAVARRKRT